MTQPVDVAKMVERHLASGVRHIERQREIVARLRSRGFDSHRAQELLGLLEDVQKTHVLHKELLARTAELLSRKRAAARASARVAALRRLALAAGSLSVSIVEAYGDWHVMVCDGDRLPLVLTFGDETDAAAYAENSRGRLGVDKVVRI